jgi:subtilisin family serine protease
MQSDLSMNVCIELQGAPYTFTLRFLQQGNDLLWKMDTATIKAQACSGNCVPLGEDLSLKFACADFLNYACTFTLVYAGDLSWKMDGSTFTYQIGDPLYPYQWHLNNSGQTTFSQSAGKSGEDLHMAQAIGDHLNGAGVILAILDSGLEIAHEDLAANVIPNGSYNYVNNTNDPTPTGTGGDHGTSVAGISAAVAMNHVGGRGVAPKAALKGFNVLAAQSEQSFIESMGGHPRSQDVAIFNMSYGADGQNYSAMNTTIRALYDASSALRGGKGGIYVKSAGNGFEDVKVDENNHYTCSEQAYGVKGLTCQNAVGEEENSRPEVITVGAFNAIGVRSSYSTAGANLWISAPGGEYGSASPAILTTDLMGKDRGYSRSDLTTPANAFEIGDPTYNPNCNYTSAFNGTSSAAPNASGAIALILQANPNLTRRDIKYILAKTARKIDPESTDAKISVDINGIAYLASDGWLTNAAGYHFHNWYGFGAVDVDAAVAMAKTYAAGSLPKTADVTYGQAIQPTPIPDNNAAGFVQTIQITEDYTIENLFAAVSIDHADTGEIGIELTSPAGTRSILLNIRSALKKGLNDDNGVLLGTNAFYGEKTKGTWTLRIIDSWPGNTGSVKMAMLRIVGY